MLMMGGSGTRYGTKIPKQFLEVNGKPLFMYTLKKYLEFNLIDKVVVVSNPEWMDYSRVYSASILKDKLLAVVPGGRTRSHSVKNGLEYCKDHLSCEDLIMIHDTTNPFVDPDAVEKAIEAAKKTGAAVVGTNQYHTIYIKDSAGKIIRFIPRETVGSGYSPEVFRFSLVYEHYLHADDESLESTTSTIALTLDEKTEVCFIPANLVNLKITYPHDMKAFLSIIR